MSPFIVFHLLNDPVPLLPPRAEGELELLQRKRTEKKRQKQNVRTVWKPGSFPGSYFSMLFIARAGEVLEKGQTKWTLLSGSDESQPPHSSP